MAENEQHQRVKKEREARTLISFPEPGLLIFTCESAEAAEDLYIEIRRRLDDRWFYKEPK